LHGSWSTNTRPPQHQKPAHEHMFVWASITSQSPLDTGLYVRYWPLRPREGPSLKLSSKVRFCGARPRSRGTGAPPSCGLRHLKHSSMGGDRPQSCAARDHEHGSPNSHPRPFKDASQTSNVQMMRSNTIRSTRLPANTTPTTITENAGARALHPPHSKTKRSQRDRAFFVPANSAVNATWFARQFSSPSSDLPPPTCPRARLTRWNVSCLLEHATRARG